MQVALYARVSTSQQEKMDTIESRLETLQAYVAAHEYTLFPDVVGESTQLTSIGCFMVDYPSLR